MSNLFQITHINVTQVIIELLTREALRVFKVVVGFVGVFPLVIVAEVKKVGKGRTG